MKSLILLLILIAVIVSCTKLNPPVSIEQWNQTEDELTLLRNEIDSLTTEIDNLEIDEQTENEKQKRLQSLLDKLGAVSE